MPKFAGLLIALALLTACATKCKPIIKVERVRVLVPTYLAVPDKMTKPLPTPKGRLSDCPMVARDRLAVIERCNADRAALADMQAKAGE